MDMYKGENLFKSKYGEWNIEYLYHNEMYVTFGIHVKSYGFSGSHSFSIMKSTIKHNIEELTVMNESLSGVCKLLDTDSDSHIKLEFKDDDLSIAGQIGGSYNENFMQFEFVADQTVIGLLRDALRGFLME